MKVSVRAVLNDVGGSPKTILEEINRAPELGPGVLLANDSKSPHEENKALRAAVRQGQAREAALAKSAEVLEALVSSQQRQIDQILAQHQSSQRDLFQAVDDLRQMVKAGHTSIPNPAVVLPPEGKKKNDENDSAYWKARHDQLLRKYIELEGQNRGYTQRLQELGEDV